MKEILLFQNKHAVVKKGKGLTLIELIVTLTIICIIIPLIYSVYINNNRLYSSEIRKYEYKNNSRVILMEIEECINSAAFSSCRIDETPARDLCRGSNIVKRLIYIEPVDKSLEPYLLVIKTNSSGIKELDRVAVSPDPCPAYIMKVDSYNIESIKEIYKSNFTSASISSSITGSINTAVDSAVLNNELGSLTLLNSDDPEVAAISHPVDGVKNYYRDTDGRLYALIENSGRLYKALLKHAKYQKVPYKATAYNIILDGIDDIRISKYSDSSYRVEVDSIWNKKTLTYSTNLSTKKEIMRAVYE